MLVFFAMIGVIAVLLMTIIPFSEVQKKDFQKIRSTIEQFQQQHNEPAEVVLNIDDPRSFDPEYSEKFRHIRFKESSLFRLNALMQVVRDAPQEFFIYAYYNVYNPNEAIEIIREKYSEVVKEIPFDSGKLFIFKKSKEQKRASFMEWINDIEQPYEKWAYNTKLIDTATFYAGKKGVKLDSVRQYGPVFTLKYGADFEHLDLINLSAKFLLSPGEHELRLVFIVEKENGQNLWKAMDLLSDKALKEGWQTAHWSIDISEIVESNDVIKTYVWNFGKKELFIDDVKVSLTTNLNH